MNVKLIISLVLAVAGYFLGIIAEATRDTGLTIYYAACGLKILFFLIAVPLAHNAGKIIRTELNTTGIPGLRIVSWVMYGVAIIQFMLFTVWGSIAAGNTRVPDGQITIDAAIFFIASLLMIAEAWV